MSAANEPYEFHGGKDVEQLIEETERAIEHTRGFLDQLADSDTGAREQIGNFVAELQRKLDRLTKSERK